jgi:gliding motility-associated-like protein
MKNIIFFLFFLFFVNNLSAQLDTTFWFVAPEVAQTHGDRPIVFRFATLASPSIITVSQPANAAFPTQIINLAANSAYTLDLTNWIDIIENKPANSILNFGFKITASSSITAYYEVTPTCNCNPDIFSLKGKNSLGTAFLTPFQNFLDNASYARSGFNIVATENNTSVTIIPTQNIVGHAAGVPFTINLNIGQTYFAEAISTAAGLHLGGSSVVSNKKIAITLHDDSANGAPYGGCADLQGDQLIPISILGTEYIALKGYLNGPDKVYILATSNGTSLSIDGVNVGTINASQTYVHTLSNPTAYIVSSDSVYVLHQSGFGCEVGEAILPPLVCTGSNVVPFTRSTNEFFALNILVPSGGENNFTYNGASGVILGSNFNFVPGTSNAWKYAQLNMSSTVIVQQGARIENPTFKFHMGLIHGGASSGCRFGYFSDFASLKYEIQSSDESYCEGSTINLTSNTLPGATYNWLGPNNFSDIGSNVNIDNAQLADAGSYYVFGQLPGACILLPDTIQISIIPVPQVPTIFNDGPWCSNSNGEIWSNVTNPFACIWLDEVGAILSQNDTLYFNSPITANSITVNLMAFIDNCFSDTTTQTIQVFDPPNSTITSPTEVCGNSIDLTSLIQQANGDPINSITWLNMNSMQVIGSTQNINNFTALNTPSTQETYILNAISNNGCINSDTIIITFNPFPLASIDYDDLCNGSEIEFSLNNGWQGNPAIGESLAETIYYGDGDVDNIFSLNPVHVYNAVGSYTVSYVLESSNGCADSVTILILLQDEPTANPLITPVCGQQVNIQSNLSLGNFNLSEILWDFPGVASTSQVNFSQTFPSSGNYSANLTLTGNNGCTFDFPYQFFIIPSVELLDLEIPNVITANGDGINDEIVLDPLFENCYSYELLIVNRWGNLVYTMKSDENSFKGKDELGQNLVPGVYTYILKSEGDERTGFITLIRD